MTRRLRPMICSIAAQTALILRGEFAHLLPPARSMVAITGFMTEASSPLASSLWPGSRQPWRRVPLTGHRQDDQIAAALMLRSKSSPLDLAYWSTDR
jgi:hypothetical protein